MRDKIKNLAGSEKIFNFVAREISKNTFVNVMGQYRPCYKVFQCPKISQGITGEEYQKAIKLYKKLPDVHTKLGMALRSKGFIEEAIEHFSKAKELNPQYGPAWVQLGLSYYMQGLVGLAYEEWQEALTQNPDLKEAEAYLKLLKKEEK